jgi:sortase A
MAVNLVPRAGSHRTGSGSLVTPPPDGTEGTGTGAETAQASEATAAAVAGDRRGDQARGLLPETVSEKPRNRRRLRDRALLAVEVVLVAALLWVLVSSLVTLGQVNRASTEAQRLLTPTATPLIRAIMLPGGHTPPDSPGGAAPEEVPAHLRDRVGAVTPLPMPTPGPAQGTRIQIPSIGVDAPIVEGDDWEALRQGAGHHIGSPDPGERGNCVISAHNDIFGEIFRRLPDVDLGDEVFVHTATQIHRYVVIQKRITEPQDVSAMYPTSGPVLTLISCHPYKVDTHRIVVTAELQP